MVNKITAEDLINKGVIGLPDVPGLTTIEMQKKLDEISIDVIIPRFNELIDNTVSASDEFSKLNTYNVGDYCIYQSVLYKCTTAITTAGEWDATKWKATAIDKELKEISSTPENKDAISDKYDSSKTYAVGDYCIYNDTLYKCKTAVTSAEEFDSSKWEATNCGKELVALNSNLTGIKTIDGVTALSANSEMQLVCANNIENGKYLVIFMYAFEANTQGQITLSDMTSSGYTTDGINNYVQVCNFVQVTDNKVTVTLFSKSNQSNRSWKTKLIRLGL